MLVQDYQIFRKRYEERLGTPSGILGYQQEKRFMEPFRIWGNIYYVGDNAVCVHLIDTGDGLLLIDSGNCGATAMLIHSIWKLGFNPEDVRWMILSHGHIDHIGGAPFFQSMFGTEVYLGEPDYRMFQEHPEQTFIQESTNLADQLCLPDRIIHDGDRLTFGKTSIDCVLVPGHSPGCVALFFDAHEQENRIHTGYYGGFGFNTLTKEYLREIGDPDCRMREQYLHSIEKVKNRDVGIFLGNHPDNNRTLEKRAFMKAHPEAANPFVDPHEWAVYLERKQKELRELIASGR